MRKDSLRKIEKMVKKDNLKGITFNPTLEECDYLNSKGIDITKSNLKRKCLLIDRSYVVDTFDFVKGDLVYGN